MDSIEAGFAQIAALAQKERLRTLTNLRQDDLLCLAAEIERLRKADAEVARLRGIITRLFTRAAAFDEVTLTDAMRREFSEFVRQTSEHPK
jgi:hypothetical protein